MTRTRLLALLAGLASLGVVPTYADLHLVAQGANSAFDAAPLFDCIAYQGCANTSYSLGAEGRLHIYTSKSISTVLQDFARCDFSTANVSALSYLEDGAANAVPLDAKTLGLSHPRPSSGSIWPSSSPRSKPSADPSDSAKADLSPALLSASKRDLLHSIEGELPAQVSTASVEKIVRALGVQSLGYSLSVAKLGDNAAAVTDHEKKTIEFGDDVRSDDLPRVVRHEFDHVLQKQIADACGAGSAFETHEARERAAYLNDGHFAADNEDFATENILRYVNP